MASGNNKIVRRQTRGQQYLEEMSQDVGNIFRDFQNKLLESSRKNIPIKNGGDLGGITVTGNKSAKKTPYKWSSPRGVGNMTFTGNSVAIPILEGLGHVGKAFTKGVSSFAASASSTPTAGGYVNPYVPYTHFNQDVQNQVENILDEKVLPAVTPTNYLAALFTEGSLDPYRGAEIKSHWSPIMQLSSVPVDILATKGAIKSGPKVVRTTANGVKTATKAVDNVIREFYPAYDLYRTIGETTPRTTPTIHAFNIDRKYFTMTGSPLFEFARTMKTSPEKAYFMRAPKDVDILKLNNGSFRHEVVGDEILPSGKVNGKFVSYGEPWKEFGFGENDALYEFPIGPKRGPSLMATDWKGRLREYSVDEVYDYMQQKKLLEKELKSMGDLPLNEYLSIKQKLIDEKYPALNKYIDTSIHGANQTVISNKKWNFDKFLKSPFWKYSENPITGQVQKELFIQQPQINLNPDRTSLRFFERRPSKLSLAERVGVPKGEREVWNPQVMQNARQFAERYGYDLPETLEEAKNMYRIHNRFFRTINTNRFIPDGSGFYKYSPFYKEGLTEQNIINMEFPELKGMTPEQIKLTLASKGYPGYYRFSPPGSGFLDDFVFVSPSLTENSSYFIGNDLSNTVVLQRPFSFGHPLQWHINADWRPGGYNGKIHKKGEVSLGNSFYNHEMKIGTQNLVPVRIAEQGDKGTNVGKYIYNQLNSRLNNSYFKGETESKRILEDILNESKNGHPKQKQGGKIS